MTLLAGALGTTAVGVAERLERAALGEEPIYTSRRVAQRLSRGRLMGWMLRVPYGLAIAIIAGRVLAGRKWRLLPEAALVGAGVFALELAAMPAVGATPPLRCWPRGHRVALFFHTLAYGLGFAAARRATGFRP